MHQPLSAQAADDIV